MIGCRQLGRVGRLGNSLYQLASTIGIARDLGADPVFPEDWIYRPFFSIPDCYFSDKLLKESDESSIWAPHIDERARVYLQDVNLFLNVLPELRSYLEPSPFGSEIIATFVNELRDWAQLEPPILGVHVRRGDFAYHPGIPNINDFFICQPLGYYLSAIWATPEAYYNSTAVFSDDIGWCQENLAADYYGTGIAHPKPQEPEHWTEAPRDFVDLIMMTTCNAFVVTGSTFGIWGALLADVPDGHVIRPCDVYGPALSYINSELLFPPDWIALDAA